MPNDFLGFQIGDVPRPRPTRPLEPPQSGDTADIILQAAGLRQKERLARSAMAQKAVDTLFEAIETVHGLSLKRQQLKLEESKTKAAMELLEASKKALDSGPRVVEEGGRDFLAQPTRQGVRFTALPKTAEEKPLTVGEAAALGVPFGTSREAAMKAGTVPVSQAQRAKIQELSGAEPILKSLEGMLGEIDLAESTTATLIVGPRLTARSKLRATKEAQFGSARRNISLLVRGMGERGVLTDTDVARILNDLPGFFDTKKSARARIARIRNIMAGARENLKKGFRGDILGAGNSDILSEFDLEIE